MSVVKSIFLVVFYIVLIKEIESDEYVEDWQCIGKYDMVNIIKLDMESKVIDRSYTNWLQKHFDELPQNITIENTGCTLFINFTFTDKNQVPSITNGPLKGKGWYRFKYAYFNWPEYGHPDLPVTKTKFAAQLHLAFYNEKYKSLEEAREHNEGIAIFAIGFRIRPMAFNEDLNLITTNIRNLTHAHNNTTVSPIKLNSLFPHIITDYYTYIGTMISAHCHQSCGTNVIWIDFEQSLKITPKQVQMFAGLNTFYLIPLTAHEDDYGIPHSKVYRSMPLDTSSAMAVVCSDVESDEYVKDWQCIGKYDMVNIIKLDMESKVIDRSYTNWLQKNFDQLPQNITMENTGCTILINFTYTDKNQPSVTNGPLKGKGWYRFKYAYFNWANGGHPDLPVTKTKFAAQLHLAFYNEKYKGLEEAREHNEGIAIFAIGFRIRPMGFNEDLNLITTNIQNLTYMYTNTTVLPIKLNSLFPHIISDYYTYIGTMISPICSASCGSNVIWIDFEQSLKITPKQVDMFAELQTFYLIPLIRHEDEYRQPNSKIYRSIPFDTSSSIDILYGQTLIARCCLLLSTVSFCILFSINL